MICQNCAEKIDDDLIFCTNCGQRLTGPAAASEATLVHPRSTAQTPAPAAAASASEPARRIGPIVAILGGILLLGILGVVIGAGVIFFAAGRDASVSNPNRNATPSRPRPSSTPARKQSPNANAGAASPTPSAAEQQQQQQPPSPTPSTDDGDPDADKIDAERIEIAPGAVYAVPFTASDKLTFVGRFSATGREVRGYVFTAEAYDEHFTDETYKTFSLTPGNADNRQTLVPGDYVLLFVVDGDTSVTVETDFKLVK